MFTSVSKSACVCFFSLPSHFLTPIPLFLSLFPLFLFLRFTFKIHTPSLSPSFHFTSLSLLPSHSFPTPLYSPPFLSHLYIRMGFRSIFCIVGFDWGMQETLLGWERSRFFSLRFFTVYLWILRQTPVSWHRPEIWWTSLIIAQNLITPQGGSAVNKTMETETGGFWEVSYRWYAYNTLKKIVINTCSADLKI